MKCSSNGKKIGTKMMMISLHSRGQPNMKMISCVNSRNCTVLRSIDSMKSFTTLSPPK